MSDWKQEHANEAETFARHELIEEVLSEFAMNMHFERRGLPEYGLKKIVYYTAQVVLARARGFEPEKLMMTEDEYNAFQIRRMHALVDAGVPTIVTDGNMVVSVDPDLDRPAQPQQGGE